MNNFSRKITFKRKIKDITLFFAGNSGDGIQLLGNQFSHTVAYFGNDLSTFSDFPAEIRAPQDTLAGISGFQIHFGSIEISSPGDFYDVLIVMNAAALKKYIPYLKKGGVIIANTSGFTERKNQLAGYRHSPLDELSSYKVYKIDLLDHSQDLLKDFPLSKKEKDLAKNMFILGFIYWIYDKSIFESERFLKTKFSHKKELLEANLALLKAGYYFGETSELFPIQFNIASALMKKGTYRDITGNKALALGIIAASKKANCDVFFSGYPITPASDILHILSSYKHLGVKTFQAEDEIAAITSAIGASYSGNIGVSATSGPGMALKQEGLGLAVMLELPLVIINVQRGGPSTGLPTKTEQADLMQALYGRNGEAPIPVLASRSPSHCFDMAFLALKIAIEHMTPVILLSDGYLANGSEPWLFPKEKDLKKIKPKTLKEEPSCYQPYQRDKNWVRPWVVPGTKGLEHRIGSLEKEILSGNVSYEGENHHKMVKIRQKKIEAIRTILPSLKIDSGKEEGQLLILSWGSTYGSIRAAMKILLFQNYNVSHLHLDSLYPLPKGLKEILLKFKKVLIPELNNAQLIHLIRGEFLIDAIGLHKIKGAPFSAHDIIKEVKKIKYF